MKKPPKTEQKNTDKRREFAAAEYARLIELYKDGGVDELKLKVFDEMIRKVAELWGILEAIKDLPTVRFNPAAPELSEETAAGKVRHKYTAQYGSLMLKLNREMLGVLPEPDDDGLPDDNDDNEG